MSTDDLGIGLSDAAQGSENNPDLIASYLVAMDAFEALRPSERAYRARATYAAFLRLLEYFSEEYSALKDARSALDFEDLQTRAIALLESSGSIAEEVTGGISHVLVDEFQDTNWSQYRLIELLCAGGAHRFEVGDSLQSIYGFRGANVEIIEREAELFDDPSDDRASVEPLRGNFRSTPSLIAGVNGMGKALFDSLGETNESGLATTDYEDLTIGREWEEQPRPGVEFLFTKTMQKDPWGQTTTNGGGVTSDTRLDLPADGKASPSRIAEARVLAQRIADLVAAGETTASEVVVLLRAFGHVDTYEMALADLGLDPYVVGGRGYWESQEIRDVVCLLEVIANPLDDAALFGALASPACSASPDTLWCLRHTAGRGRGMLRIKHALDALVSDVPSDRLNEAWEGIEGGESDETSRPDPSMLDSIQPEESSRLIEFWKSIGELRQRTSQLGLAEMIETTVTMTGYDLATLIRDRGKRRWANVRKLIRLARDLEASDGVDLRGLLLYIESEKQREREATATTVPEDHDGVRLMTVHSAKGLEFDTVAVADLGRQLKANSRPALVERAGDGSARFGLALNDPEYGRKIAFLDHEVLDRQAQARELEEELRIAHVAFTRAEKRLLVSGTFAWKTKTAEIWDLSRSSSVANRLVAMIDELKPESKDKDGEAYESYVSEIEPFEDPVPRQDLATDCRIGPSRLEWTFPTTDAGLALNPGASAALSAEGETETIVLPPDSLPSAPPSS
ncbi:MAG: UvrD-helicase domain-containing protein, partial [bacterium]